MRQTPKDVGRAFAQIGETSKVVFANHATTTIDLRAEERCAVYASDHANFDNEHLVVLFEGECRVRHRPGDPQYMRVLSSGRAWIRFSAIDQTVERMSDEIFTSLDRPAPMSPEMRAVHELMRRNEIEREALRNEMEERFHRHENRNRRENRATVVPSAPAEEDVAGQPDDQGSSAKAAKSGSGEDQQAVPDAAVPKPKANRSAKSKAGKRDDDSASADE